MNKPNPQTVYAHFQNVIVRPIGELMEKMHKDHPDQYPEVSDAKLSLLMGLRQARFKAPGLMDVVVERINALEQPFAVVSIASYYEQNGDLMRDPDIEVILTPAKSLFGWRFRNDGLGIDVEVKPLMGRMDTQAILRSQVHNEVLDYLHTEWLPQIRNNYQLQTVEWEMP